MATCHLSLVHFNQHNFCKTERELKNMFELDSESFHPLFGRAMVSHSLRKALVTKAIRQQAPPKRQIILKMFGAFGDGRIRWTYPPTGSPKLYEYILISVFTFCSFYYKIVKQYLNCPQKYKHFA